MHCAHLINKSIILSLQQGSLQSDRSKLYFIYMKSPHHPDPPSFRQKLPYIQFTNPQNYRNQSLKKIVFHQSHSQHSSLHNIGLLPRLQQKSKLPPHNDPKHGDSSLQKNMHNWNGPQSNLKKRQKLLTQGPYSQEMTEADESFVSLTNKLIHQGEDVKDTMFDFRKKIEQNKLIIKKEIEKKNKENHSSANRQKSFVKKKRPSSSRLIDESPEYEKRSKKTLETPISQSKMDVSLKQLSSSKKKKPERKRRQKTQVEHKEHESVKSLPKRRSEGLFTELQVILDDKIRPQQEKSIKEQKKLRALLSKLSKFKQQKQSSSHSIYEPPHSLSGQILHFQSSTDTLSPSSKIRFKREANYHEWNKVDLLSTSQISYRKSSFEEELKKVMEYTDRNDASLEKYLVMRKELMKIGFQVQLGHCGARGK